MSESWKLLVVEDNPDDRVFLRLLLRADTARSYRIVEVETGAAGLRACREAAAPFDCILLDYHLPDFDAQEWLEAWGESGGLPSPVVVLTGVDAAAIDVRALLRAGAEDFIGKSWINAESLARALDNAAERFAMARQVREGADRYRWLFENMPSGYGHWRWVAAAEPADFECLAMNAQLEPVTGWREPLGRRLRDIVRDPPQCDPDLFHLLVRVTVTGQSERGEFQLNPGRRWISVAAYRPAPGECVTVIDDITARKRELEASEERFRFATESSQIGVWDWNLQTGTLHRSGLLADQLGVDPAELFQDPEHQWQDLLHPDDRARIADAIYGKHEENRSFELEMRLRVKPEGYRWVLTRGRVWERGPNGEPLRILGTCTDIDARKRAEALNRRLAAIIESSSDLIATATPEGEVDYMNRAGRALLGIEANESLQHTRIPEYHPAWAYRRVREEGIPVALAHGPWLGDTAMLRRDGSEVPVSQLILGHKDPVTGKVDFISTICRDLSERKEIEQALCRLQEEQALILDSAPALIWYKDTENRILRINAAVAESLGLPKDRIEGHRVAEFYPEDADRYYQDDLAVIRSGQPRLGIEEPYRLPDGEQRWLQTDKVPLTGDAGQVTRLLVISVDITERKAAEAALERTRDQLAEAQRIAHLGSWEYIAATRTTVWSDEQKRIYGLDPAQPSPNYAAMLHHLAHPDDAPELDLCFRAALENRTPFENENRIVRPDGTVRWIYNQAHPYFDEAGQLLRYVGATLDITERKAAEEALRQIREDLARAQEVGQIGGWRLDVRQNVLTWSDEVYRIFGISPGTPQTYESFLALIHPDDRDYVDRSWRAALAGEPYDVEHRLVPGGRATWVREKAYLEFDAAGGLRGGFGIVQDISQRKAAEADMAESRQQLALALEAGQVGFWDWDIPTGRVQFGGQWSAMLGSRPEEIEPNLRAWERLVHPEDMERVLARLTEHLEGRSGFYECEYRMRHKDGSWRWILDRGQVVDRDAEDRPLRAAGTHTDVTARRLAEEALREADRQKDEFLATLAHELRNPLAPIRNAVHVLQKFQASGQIHQERTPALLAIAERQVAHMAKLVDDLLDISRISRGKIVLQREPRDLASTIQHAIETTQPLIEACRHRLQIQLPSEPLTVFGDGVRLAQVFANLLNNAAKYMEPGGAIHVQAQSEAEQALVSIQDEGLGIPAEMLPRIFDLFTQVDAGSGHSQGGLGIGLALTRKLVELHGGRIEARSDGPGRGSEFRVYLPLLATGNSTLIGPERPPPQPLPACRIMIVDDNRDAADSLALSLEPEGFEVQVFYGGASALESLAAFKPRAILLDLDMPGWDGYETARRIRCHPDGAKVFLVALSGWGQDEDRRRTREAGFDHHLVKPVDLDRLISLLASASQTSAPLDGGDGA